VLLVGTRGGMPEPRALAASTRSSAFSPWDDFDQDGGMNVSRRSEYERRARDQIHEWKNPGQGWFGQTLSQIGWPVDRLGTLLKSVADSAGLSDVINKALNGNVGVLADAALWTVSAENVYGSFAGSDTTSASAPISSPLIWRRLTRRSVASMPSTRA